MANIHILADPLSDYGTYSGGAWATALPLANLKTQQPKQVARSTSAALSSTRFILDLGASKPLQTFALIGSNLSQAGKIRIRVSAASTGASPTLDVTVPAYPPNATFGSLPWGELPWDGYRTEPRPNGIVTFYQHTAVVYGRYVLVDILDTTNAAAYVQIGRFMAGQAFVPKINFIHGAGFSFRDESRQSRSVGGQDWFDKRPKHRCFTCSFDALSEAEAYGAAYDLQSRIGITGNLLLIYDPKDKADIVLRRTLYGRQTSLENIVTANASVDRPYSWSLAVEELL